jgi:Uma2 family endonuclease
MIQAKRAATIDDLYRVEEKAELVNGEIVIMSPASIGHGRKSSKIYISLLEYEQRTGQGCAVPDNVGFIVDLPNRQSFSPDAAYYFGSINEDEFVDGAPDFAAEVRSPEDFGPTAELALAAKRADYFAAGTKVVWDVDMIREKLVRVYRASCPTEPRIYGPGDIAEAEPAVPGWVMAVAELLK